MICTDERKAVRILMLFITVINHFVFKMNKKTIDVIVGGQIISYTAKKYIVVNFKLYICIYLSIVKPI